MSCGKCFNRANEVLGGGTPGNMAVATTIHFHANEVGDATPKTVGFALDGQRGRAVMGDVQEERGQFYVVRITSTEAKKDRKLIGQTMMVAKNGCTVLSQAKQGTVAITPAPTGLVQITSGVAQAGDMYFDNEDKTWKPIMDFSIGDPAKNFWELVRPESGNSGDVATGQSKGDNADFEANVNFQLTYLNGDAGNEPEWQPSDDSALTEIAAEAVRRGKVLYHTGREGTTPAYPASSRRARCGLDEPRPPQKREMWYDDQTRQFQVGDVEFNLEGDYVAATRDQPAEYPSWEESGQHSQVRAYGSYEEAFTDLVRIHKP
jgi:hypothetical protein